MSQWPIKRPQTKPVVLRRRVCLFKSPCLIVRQRVRPAAGHSPYYASRGGSSPLTNTVPIMSSKHSGELLNTHGPFTP